MPRIHRLFPALAMGASLHACSCEGGGGLGQVVADLQVAPTRLDFGDVPLGEPVELTLSLKNVGASALEIARTRLVDDTASYALPGTRVTLIAAGSRADLRVVFLPVALGDAPGRLIFESNDPDSPTTVELSGRGVRRSFDVFPEGGTCGNTPDSVSFGQGVVGVPVERRLRLESTGSVPVTVRSARIEGVTSGEWSMDPVAAGTVIQPGSPLSVAARFTAADVGDEAATFVFATDAGEDVRITACARGIVAELCLAPVPLDLGQVVINQSRTATLTVTNCGGRPLTIDRAALAASAPSSFELTLPSNAPIGLTPGAELPVYVRFSPSSIGAANTVLELDSDAAGADPRVPVLAEGVEDCSVSLLPSVVDYGVVGFGATATRPVLLTNDSRKACTVSSLVATASAGFTLSAPPTLPLVLRPGEGTVIDLAYSPPMRGRVDRGTLVARAGRAPAVARLSGNVPTTRGCQLELTPPSISFGTVAPRVITRASTRIRNVSTESCIVHRTGIDGRSSPGFGDESNAVGPIAPGDERVLTVSYFPFGSGRAGAILRVETNDADTPVHEVVVSAFVPPPGICVDPTHIPFGDQPGVTTRDFRIWACGSAPVLLTDLAFTTPDPEFSIAQRPTLPDLLQPGDERMVTVRFEPADDVGDTAVIAVGSDDPAEPVINVNVTGGAEIVPPSAGRFLYYWEIGGAGGDIVRLPLQGAPVPQPYWGARTGQQCAGCHSISPDGRYLAIIGDGAFNVLVVDTQNDQRVMLPFNTNQTSFVTWNPNVNTSPPYQFAYDDADIMKKASVFAGLIGELQGANTPGVGQKMASWGPAGKIAFVRGNAGGGFGFFGPTDIYLVDENGGQATPLAGVSNNGAANYFPKFSPDGRWLAYTYSQAASGTLSAQDAKIQLVRTDNSGQIVTLPQMNTAAGASSFPTWAIDGSFLSFSSNRPGGAGSWDIYIAPIDLQTGADGPPQNLIEANTEAFEHAAFWSP